MSSAVKPRGNEMTTSFLEHVNFTVTNPDATAERLIKWFGWHVRWSGPAKDKGYAVHVGNENSYVALYAKPDVDQLPGQDTYITRGGLNHVAIVVDDLDATEKRILADGIKTHNHGDYEPGRRFYFHDDDEIEFEVVSYVS